MRSSLDPNHKYEFLSKAVDEYRVTKLGTFFRDKKLDELPQILNVFKGEMSLVGPRPYPLIAALYRGKSNFEELNAKPGLTGIWQTLFSSYINGRHKIRLDVFYAKQCSTWLDIKLLFLTIPRVILGERYASHGKLLRQDSASWKPKSKKAA